MVQDYGQQTDASLFPKLYAITVVKQMLTHLRQEDGDKISSRIPEHIGNLADEMHTSFLIGVSADNWGDDWGDNRMSYLTRLGLDSLIVLEAVADASVERLDSLVSDVKSLVTTTEYDSEQMRTAMHLENESTGVTPLSRERFLEEQVATQYGAFMIGFHDWPDNMKEGWESHYANQFLHPGVNEGHWDTTIPLWNYGAVEIDMNGTSYQSTALDYVEMVRHEINALLSLKQYLMRIASAEGLSSITDQTVKGALRHAYDETKDNFVHREKLRVRLDDAAFFLTMFRESLSKEELARRQNMGKLLQLKDSVVTNMASAIFDE